MTTINWPNDVSDRDLGAELTKGFGDTLMDTLGIELLEVSADRVVAEMPVDQRGRALMGGVHAGAMVSLADTTATFAAIARRGDPSPEHFPVAIGPSSQVVGNVQEGVLRAESTVAHAGRTIMVVETRITSDTGRLLSTVTTTHFVRS